MARCPFCDYEDGASSFKLLRSSWRYRFYEATPPRSGRAWLPVVKPKAGGALR